jgi:hypothetical protein
MLIGSSMFCLVTSVRDLCVSIDANLVTMICVKRTLSQCFTVLHHWDSCIILFFQTLVIFLVLPYLDHGNSANFSQSVLNASAWIIFHLCHLHRFTDALVRIHYTIARNHTATWVHSFMFLTRRRYAPESTVLLICFFQLCTIGSIIFNRAAAQTWDDLLKDSHHATSAPTISTLCSRWNTHLVRHSFPDFAST